MRWYKQVIVFLILLLLVATFAAALHHHENTANDHNCPVCFVSYHQAASRATVAFDGIPFITEAIYSAPAPQITEQTLVSVLANRAPPA